MTLSQENFNRAVENAAGTLSLIIVRHNIDIAELSAKQLRKMSWDLEAIAQSLQTELMNRLEGPDPMDTA